MKQINLILTLIISAFITVHLYSQVTFSKVIPLDLGYSDFPRHMELHDNSLFIATSHICNDGTQDVSFCSSVTIFDLMGNIKDSIQLRSLALGNHDVFELSDEDELSVIGFSGELFGPAPNKIHIFKSDKDLDSNDYKILDLDSLNVQSFFPNGILRYENNYLIFGNGLILNDPYPKGFIFNYDLEFNELKKFNTIEYQIPENHVIDLNISTNNNLIYGNLFQSLNSSVNNYLLAEIDQFGESIRTYVSEDVIGGTVLPRMARLNNGDYVMVKSIADWYNKLEIICVGNDDFSLKWKNVFDINSNPEDGRIAINSIIVLSNGDILAIGSQSINSSVVDNIVGYLKRLDQNGQTVWEKYYLLQEEDGDVFGSKLSNAVELPDGSIVVIGSVNKRTEENLNDDDLWMLKLDSSGCLNNNDCGEEAVLVSTSLSQLDKELLEVNFFPNPNNGNFEINNTYNEPLFLDVKNDLGQHVKSLILSQGLNKFIFDEFNAGLYYLVISDKNNKTLVKKMIKID